MTEPSRDLDSAFAHIADGWDAQRTERTLAGLQRKRSSARRARVAMGVTAVAAVAVLGFATWRERSSSTPGSAIGATVEQTSDITLADGSRVYLRDASSRVKVIDETQTQATLELQAGEARFDVRHRQERAFHVLSGEVIVQVLGTEFTVERVDERTRVVVLRGRVAVSWPGGRSELGVGEAGWFPRQATGDEAAAVAAIGPTTRWGSPPFDEEFPMRVPPVSVGHSAARSSQLRAAGRSAKLAARRSEAESQATTWREPAEQGDYDRAYELLRRAPQPSPDDVEELLLAADTARLSGHPSAALPFLKQVIDGHSHDSRAPLAAFTLGGLLMQQLGQPREAEAAYARARSLSLNSSLAEDALARQVEAAHRAGDASRARELAEEYLRRYPQGRRVHAVQRFAGLIK